MPRASLAVKELRATLPTDLLAEIRRAGRNHVLGCYLWLLASRPILRDLDPEHRAYLWENGAWVRKPLDGVPPIDFNRDLLTDGSCMNPADPLLAVASGAFVQLTTNGEPWIGLSAAVPGQILPCDAAGEHWATLSACTQRLNWRGGPDH